MRGSCSSASRSRPVLRPRSSSPSAIPSRTAAVVNAGISGNRILRDGRAAMGPSALRRFDHDVLAPSGVTTLILLEGTNDIQAPAVPAVFGDDPPAPRLTTADVIAGLTELA